mmetsp:Transcript_8086/g.23972  ORF Transcript_8086/g.23972 Transcript_8086/m.23972 type:complete len:212 (-) Transcript_8086:75-710(-)
MPWVHQMHSSYSSARPSAQRRTPLLTSDTSHPTWRTMPRSDSALLASALAPGVCCGSRPLRVTKPTDNVAPLLRRANSFVNLACIVTASSKPPAPPPTIINLRLPFHSGTCHSNLSHLAPKPSIGFTGVMPAASPWRPSCTRGAEPMLIDSTSYASGGRPPSNRTRLFAKSKPVAVACTSLTLAKRARTLRSKWHSCLSYRPATWPGNMPL